MFLGVPPSWAPVQDLAGASSSPLACELSTPFTNDDGASLPVYRSAARRLARLHGARHLGAPQLRQRAGREHGRHPADKRRREGDLGR